MFKNRHQAGKKLAEKLQNEKIENPIVISLPRGGVPIGSVLSKKLKCPHTVLVVRKIGDPHNPEFGIGAIAEDDVLILDNTVIHLLQITEEEISKTVHQEKEELNRRVEKYRHSPLPNVSDKTVILTDDGLATGVTAQAAVNSIKKQNPKWVVFATPVCTQETKKTMQQITDNFICLKTSTKMRSIGEMYQHFEQLTDDEITKYLKNNKSQQNI